jgi:hypothetical protein
MIANRDPAILAAAQNACAEIADFASENGDDGEVLPAVKQPHPNNRDFVPHNFVPSDGRDACWWCGRPAAEHVPAPDAD